MMFRNSGRGAQEKIDELHAELEYLQLEVSRLRSIVRHLVAPISDQIPILASTAESFDYQWDSTPDGNWTETRPDLTEREPLQVLDFTGLPADWFPGKRVLDAGCGSGRFSYAFASLGSDVVALDRAPSGVQQTAHACERFGQHVQTKQHDLRNALDLNMEFDLVWSFGVLHHTGDTFNSFLNIAHVVKPGGYLCIMLYAEPGPKDSGSMAYYAEVESLRRATSNMTLVERYEHISQIKGANVGGWFDAVSPRVNDTYSLYELELWFKEAGFKPVKRFNPYISHVLVAQKKDVTG